MASENNQPLSEQTQVRLAEIKAGTDKVAYRHGTLRIFGCSGFFLIGMVIVALTIVKSADPPWAKVCLAILGPAGTVVVLFGMYLSWVRRQESRKRGTKK